MRIVGLLQNPWFKPDTQARLIRRYQHDYEFRRRVLARSHTGIMLRTAFGQELFERIYWTECSFVTGQHSGHRSKADLEFIRNEIAGAHVVIAFGVIAREAMRSLLDSAPRRGFEYFESPHPACRLKKSFLSAAKTIREALQQ